MASHLGGRGHASLLHTTSMGAFLHENVASKHVNMNSTPGWGTACYDPLHRVHTHWLTHTHTLTGGMQQAIGQSGVVSVAQTQLAVGHRDADVSTNTRLRLRAQGLDAGLRERISQWWTMWTPGQHPECCVRSLAWFCFACVYGSARALHSFCLHNSRKIIISSHSAPVTTENDF